MSFENYSKKEKPRSREKWFRLDKKIFGFDTEFSVDNSDQPFTFDCNLNSKKMKVGTNTETIKIIGSIAFILFMKKFFPKIHEENMRRCFKQKNSQA